MSALAHAQQHAVVELYRAGYHAIERARFPSSARDAVRKRIVKLALKREIVGLDGDASPRPLQITADQLAQTLREDMGDEARGISARNVYRAYDDLEGAGVGTVEVVGWCTKCRGWSYCPRAKFPAEGFAVCPRCGQVALKRAYRDVETTTAGKSVYLPALRFRLAQAFLSLLEGAIKRVRGFLGRAVEKVSAVARDARAEVAALYVRHVRREQFSSLPLHLRKDVHQAQSEDLSGAPPAAEESFTANLARFRVAMAKKLDARDASTTAF